METETLSDQQQSVLEDIIGGRNVFVTGPGGTGKSFLLNRLREFMGGRGKMDVCGSTGIAAVNVGGVTLHSWAGIGLGKESASALAMRVRNNQPACQRVLKTDLLAIDEVSMIDAALLDKLDEIFQLVRDSELPFGGMQLVLLGDFLQLKPVDGKYCFTAKVWPVADFKVHLLTKVFRHADKAFAEALMEMRTGTMTAGSKALLNGRFKAKVGSETARPVYLTTHNAKAEEINTRHLAELPGVVTRLTGRDTGSPAGLKLLEKYKVPKELDLKVGARVICCTNFDPGSQVMNGSAGTVVAFRTELGSVYPVVEYDNGARLVMPRVRKEITLDGKVIGCREQVPLRLGYSLTTHSAQGLTLDLVEAHLGNAFERGQIYVALSRVRTLEGLSIFSLNKAMIEPCPVAMAFYQKHLPAPSYEDLMA